MFSYPKTLRLLKRRQFEDLKRSSTKTQGSYISCHFCFSGQESCKLGLSVPKRFGKAHQRNRFKRQLRELFRLNQHQIPEGLYLHVAPRTWALNAKSSSIEHDFKQIMSYIAGLQGDQEASVCTNS